MCVATLAEPPSQHHAGGVAGHPSASIVHGGDAVFKLLGAGLAGEGDAGFEGDGDLGPFGEGSVGGGLFAAFYEVGADAAVAFARDGGFPAEGEGAAVF